MVVLMFGGLLCVSAPVHWHDADTDTDADTDADADTDSGADTERPADTDSPHTDTQTHQTDACLHTLNASQPLKP